jgi:glycosyltransferase involved in cell wall biosynthesis
MLSNESMSPSLRLLFIGQTWNGSSARSLRDSLSSIPGVEIDDIGEDHYYPKARSLLVRGVNKLLRPQYRAELSTEVLRRCASLKPNAVIVYKGALVTAATVDAVKAMGIKTVNVFPDCSPHAHGNSLSRAMGRYDLVISTKPFHPEHWNTTYGYSNACVCVPHGYDPEVHYWAEPPGPQNIDVVIAASWRIQYQNLMTEVGRLLPDPGVSVALAGPGWMDHRKHFPDHWQFPGPIFGRAYGDFVRRGKIVIAPVHTDVMINGKVQPGDQDTTRTYELASAGTFFLHRRTPYALHVYKEGEECDFWDDAAELVEKIRHYLPRDNERRAIALSGHQRAVPAYSIPERTRQVLEHIESIVRGDPIQ